MFDLLPVFSTQSTSVKVTITLLQMEPNQPTQQRPIEDKARIEYRVEYRDRDTNELVRHQVSEESDLHDAIINDEPNLSAFTLIKTYKIQGSSSSSPPASTNITSPPSYSLRLNSVAIVNALRSVVQYYPSQDLTGDIIIEWPYPILVHHYDELTKFRDEVSQKDSSDLCEREKGVQEDLSVLLQYLDKSVMPDVQKEKERNERGLFTFKDMWIAYKPGTTILGRFNDETKYRPLVIHSVSGGVFAYPPHHWTIQFWQMRYNGACLGRVLVTDFIDKFDGEAKLSRTIFVGNLENKNDLPDIVSIQVTYGEMYWNLLRRQYRQYKGKTRDSIPKEIDSPVMVDIESFYEDTKESEPSLMNVDDCRNWMSDCKCRVCREKLKNADDYIKVVPLFEDYNYITIQTIDTLTTHQYFLCTSEMPAFVFKTRTWETLHVGGFTELKFEETLINSLVMDPQRKRTLKALAKCFSRLDKNEDQLKEEPWTADFIQGKGNGLIFLLHGRPGIGKTYTAECIAAFTKRPLMVLTPSDIGTDPASIELNLTKNFKRAKSWGAVLLIDEADVFMERRSVADLVRNSLVAGFLRALEFYDGILFLTTNRVGSFDDAFISRVHVQLYYPDFDDDQRQQIWQTFVDKLSKERGNSMRLNLNAKEYIRGNEMRALKWNGREIRNAFQTAVSLAEYDAEKGEDGKIMITDDHLRAVVELSRDFKEYLGELHRGDEAKRAERNYERLDSYARS
ncbi:P-loop containing nucleoside triphosphate hydrolase protein [Xylaria bambusicola]|uniref:P-loop containing nucleoside triphosphate hydrolase protein n=1 Tax=Xylaria bambusicola TaxID=326684 RepID=UPI002007E152|nr:P-loop containing nucleoside triphosphate hydrolase protein [Xylaria bambusicola]KAI0514731.1 P-loop containing nucleoside triphosphate hydrolase protein [Xylaria bambusicola]